MNTVQIPLGPLQTNAYILSNENGECLIFDPGSEADVVINHIQSEGLIPKAILLTHGHFDHIGAVDEVRDFFSIPVYIHQNEEKWLEDPSLNGSVLFMREEIFAREADVIIPCEQKITIDSFQLTVLETPGHSPGSVSYYCKEAGVVFSGDALFYGSIGRTDLPNGNQDVLTRSIQKKLYRLPEKTIVCCGHGPETTIEREKKSNPFVREK